MGYNSKGWMGMDIKCFDCFLISLIIIFFVLCEKGLKFLMKLDGYGICFIGVGFDFEIGYVL